MKKVFIPVVGQVINIGDTLHRKILISWLRDRSTELHIYVGNAPQSFIEALDLKEEDIVYSSISKWLFSIIFKDFLRKKLFIFNPGEITFSNSRLVKELVLFPFYLYIRITGGKILRIGVAAQSDIKIKYKWLWNKLIGFSNKIYWRTIKSSELFKKGEVIPDLAFYKIDQNIVYEKKYFIVISMRGDRKLPSQKWFEAIKEFQQKNNLSIAVVSQVKIDNERAKEIAAKLRGEYYIWENQYNHNRQEEIVNEIYRKSKIAISDRLHVLIAAYTKGVIPTDVSVTKSNKVQDHFDVLPLEDVSVFESKSSKEEIIDFLQSKLDKGFNETKMYNTFSRLNKVKRELPL
ncbi:polysaccharide pyruvyl transferase WcaK-like protein [Mesonia hippocampi]|uniref:Polysaccharide pyruvyl transferase WcaK-like protein n=1 Tax=Mesonia hippocampi TaxID=1628250 RepID=A0A840EL10_9FLAO|nr:polysaccharide pyruvyl transferase family protein [Mesonia hippocampi]MBB4120082.1 polysaccharide pyruvyl transferase WcaK-like protein [Mesonia hippocampi]